MLSPESSLVNPFEGGFPALNSGEPPFLLHHFVQVEESVILSPRPSHEPVNSNSGSNISNPEIVAPNSNGLGSIMDERKRRRMISNRLSAQRSRMRKQKHLENLRNQLNRLRVENRELRNAVRLAFYHDQMMRCENKHLRSEAGMLLQRLWDFRQSSAGPTASAAFETLFMPMQYPLRPLMEENYSNTF